MSTITAEIKGEFVRNRYRKVPRYKSALGSLMASVLISNMPANKCKFHRDECFIWVTEEENPDLYAKYHEQINPNYRTTDKLMLSFKHPPKRMKDVVSKQTVHLKLRVDFWKHNGIGAHVQLIKIIDIGPAPPKEPEKTVQEAVQATNDLLNKAVEETNKFFQH